MQQIFKGTDEFFEVIRQFNRIMIVHGRSFENYPIKSLFENIPLTHFSQFASNPIYEDVCKGVDLFRREKCEAIIAVGGGSAIDVAKCIKLFSKMDKNVNYLQQDKRDTKIPMIAIPATAGTGSESTQHAVVYYGGEKQSISHPSIVPDYVFLIPSILKGLPVYQKKCTMLDALCQAIESWWSVKSTDESKKYSRKAIEKIMKNWEEYLSENTETAAEKIMEAANYAGRAINITATTAAHAMSYKITSLYQIPHGHAVAICLPEVWAYLLEHTRDCVDDRGSDYLQETLTQISEMISLSQFKSMLIKMDMKYPRTADKESELQVLTKSVNPVRLKNNPVALSADVLREMYRRIIQ